jgi:glutamine---fructose-6-phosphate transaminase (isomerizing)
MCGIVGYVGQRPCQSLLLGGLATLEYRGYDSAGLAVQHDVGVDTVRAVGNLQALRDKLGTGDGAVATLAEGTCGIGHTRWATHGRVSEDNAHPHTDAARRVFVVLNGIVENHDELRAAFEAGGVPFRTDNDAEAVAQLIGALYEGDLATAVRETYAQLRGHFAFVAMSVDEPGLLVAARRECPLVVGVGEDEHFVASAISAFAAHTREVRVIEDGDLVVLRRDGMTVHDADGALVDRPARTVDAVLEIAERDGHETYMLKEIHEQGAAVARTLAGRLGDGPGTLGELGQDDDALASLDSLRIIACGTSLHAGLIARYAIERWARLPVEVEVASEFRYREPVLRPGALVVGITQSGETADTLAAMRLARAGGAHVVALTNVDGSQATRDADAVLLTAAGIEVGVAATKTFAAQVAALYALGLRLARARGTLGAAELEHLTGELRRLPALIDATVARSLHPARLLGGQLARSDLFLFIGRDVGSAVAMEGALKLKEISYVPAEAYPAGELKHGPIALIGEDTPVVVCATASPLGDKLRSNIEEVSARGARVIAVVSEGDGARFPRAAHRFVVPDVHWLLAPLVAVVPLQLLAYEIATARGLDVDQPRNLAKTVTVE